MKVIASSAICSMELDGEPLDAPTPRLSNAITWRWAASPSTTRGSQLSSTAARWTSRISGVPPWCLPSSRQAKATPPAEMDWVGAVAQVDRSGLATGAARMVPPDTACWACDGVDANGAGTPTTAAAAFFQEGGFGGLLWGRKPRGGG